VLALGARAAPRGCDCRCGRWRRPGRGEPDTPLSLDEGRGARALCGAGEGELEERGRLVRARMFGPEPELERELAVGPEGEELELEEGLGPEEPSDSSESRSEPEPLDCSESPSERALERMGPVCEELAGLEEAYTKVGADSPSVGGLRRGWSRFVSRDYVLPGCRLGGCVGSVAGHVGI
jgi:hypothetical protein